MKNKRQVFPDRIVTDETGLLGWGADLSVSTLLEAYSKGIFPWSGEQPIPWYSPDPRLVLFPTNFRASRSLRKLARSGRYTLTFDRDFRGVMSECASIPRPGQDGTWISPRMIDAYERLHRLGIAHSVEVARGGDGELVGGLYGLSLGRAFFGESMFSTEPNTSKLALLALSTALTERQYHFIDCQQETPHMMSLGAEAIPRADFLRRLAEARAEPGIRGTWTAWSA